MTHPSRKKARPVRKPRALRVDPKGVGLTAHECSGTIDILPASTKGFICLTPYEAARLYEWLGKALAWRADQERRKK